MFQHKNLFNEKIFVLFILALIIGCNQNNNFSFLENKIKTRAGELSLKYKNGNTVLSGVLSRATPCVEWDVKVNSSDGNEHQSAVFEIFDKNELKKLICIQVLGEPQEINANVSASEKTKYLVIFRHQAVFSGELK